MSKEQPSLRVRWHCNWNGFISFPSIDWSHLVCKISNVVQAPFSFLPIQSKGLVWTVSLSHGLLSRPRAVINYTFASRVWFRVHGARTRSWNFADIVPLIFVMDTIRLTKHIQFNSAMPCHRFLTDLSREKHRRTCHYKTGR